MVVRPLTVAALARYCRALPDATETEHAAPGNWLVYARTMTRTCRGSCHCGAVRFEADLDLAQPACRLDAPAFVAHH